MGPAGIAASPQGPLSAPAERPLSPQEERLLRRQIAGLRYLDTQDRSQALAEWKKGAFLKAVRDWGLWRRSAEHPARSFLDFVQQVTGLRSRGAVERRLLLVESYGREEFLAYVAAGTCPTALCEIARAEAGLRPQLLRLARAGLTVAEVGLLRGAARALKRKAAPSAEEQARQLEQRLIALLSTERVRRSERRQQQRGGGDEGEDRDDRGETRVASSLEEELAAERGREDVRAALRQQAASQAAQAEAQAAHAASQASPESQAAEPRAAPRQQAAELAAEPRAAPRQQAAELAAEQQRLRQQAAELAAEQQRLRQQAAELAAEQQRLRQQAEQLQADRDALQAEAEERAALWARRAEGPEGLSDREAQLSDREAQLAELEAQLARQAEELAAERVDLDFHRERAAREAEDLAQLRAHLGRERAQLLDWAITNKRIAWPAPPWGMDETLLWLRDRLEETRALGDLARHFLDKKQQLPQHGTIARVFELKELVQSVAGQLTGLLKDVATDVRRARPSEVEAYLRRQLEAERNGRAVPVETAARPSAPRPPKEFARPTAAILGTALSRSPQHGVLGFDARGELVTLDLSGVQTVGLFGQQGAGKSHSILALAEAALGTLPGVSITPEPLAVIHCHYHGDADSYAPPYGAYFQENQDPAAVALLRGELLARPQALPARRRLVLVPPMDPAELARRRAALPGVEVQPLRLSARELGLEGMKLLMGAGGGGARGAGGRAGVPLYMMKLGHALSTLRDPSPEEFRAALAKVKLSPQVRDIVEERLRLMEQLLSDEPLAGRIGPGDFVGLDLRAPWMDESMAMAMFTVSMNAFAQAQVTGEDGQPRPFRKMMIFDEAHKYMGRGTVSAEMLKMVREMRHRGMWVVYASQDPESVHPALIKLSSLIVAHQLKAKSSLKTLRECAAAFADVEPQELASLARGEALVLAGDCAEPLYRLRPQKLRIRPTCARTAL